MLSNSTKININEARRVTLGKRTEGKGRTQKNYDIVVLLRGSIRHIVCGMENHVGWISLCLQAYQLRQNLDSILL